MYQENSTGHTSSQLNVLHAPLWLGDESSRLRKPLGAAASGKRPKAPLGCVLGLYSRPDTILCHLCHFV